MMIRFGASVALLTLSAVAALAAWPVYVAPFPGIARFAGDTAVDGTSNVLTSSELTGISGDQAILVTKYDRNANEKWETQLSDTGFDHPNDSGRLCSDADGDVFLASSTVTASGNLDVIVSKLSPTGVVKWVKKFSDDLAIAWTVVGDRCDANGNVIAVYRNASGPGLETLKITSTGTLVWTNMLSNITSEATTPKVFGIDSQSNIVVGGSDAGKVFVVKYKTNGQTAWTVDDAHDKAAVGVQALGIDADDHVIVASRDKKLNKILRSYRPVGTLLWQTTPTLNGSLFDMSVAPDGTVRTVASLASGGINRQLKAVIQSFDGLGTEQWVVTVTKPSADDTITPLQIETDTNGASFAAFSTVADALPAHCFVMLVNAAGGNVTKKNFAPEFSGSFLQSMAMDRLTHHAFVSGGPFIPNSSSGMYTQRY